MNRSFRPTIIRAASSARSHFSRLVICGAVATGLYGSSALATAYYWDANGTTAGAGTAPVGTWGTDAFFNSDATGGGAGTFVSTLLGTDTVQFVAAPGSVATAGSGSGTYVISVSGTQTALGIIFRQTGAITIGSAPNAGTINLGASGIDNTVRTVAGTLNDATGFTINSAINLTANQTWATNVGNGTNATSLIAGNVGGTGNLTLSNASGRPYNLTGGVNMTGSLTTSGGNSGSPINVTGVIGSNVTGVNVGFGSIGNILTISSTSATVGNTYGGTTSVTAGTLRLNNSLTTATASLTSTGAVTIAGSAAGLSGQNGVSAGLLTVTGGGQIAPGNLAGSATTTAFSVGTLHLGTVGGVVLTNAVLNFDLASTAAGASDRIILGANTTATGALTLGSTLAFNFSNSVSGVTVLETGVPYTLITAANIPDISATTISTVFANGIATGYTAQYSVVGTSLDVTFAVAVPEPSTWAGMLALFAGLGWSFRKRLLAGRAIFGY